jgi:hypothetical protein
MKHLLAVFLLCSTLAAVAKPCKLEAADGAWVQTALNQWDEAAALLGRGVAELPWAIFYDENCVWHLNPGKGRHGAAQDVRFTFNGRPVPVKASPYRKQFKLPNGQKLTADAAAFSSIKKDETTFYVMALPSVWRKDPRVRPDEDVEKFATGVMLHEMTHTIHLLAIAKAVEKLARTSKVPTNLNDDHLQEVFEKNPDYVRDYKEEIEFYYEANRTQEDPKALELLRAALRKSDERRSKYFQGDHAHFRSLEPMFLNMEGVATWVAYKVENSGEPDPSKFAGRFWSQNQGLVLFLLLDRFHPGWKTTVFDDSVPSPFAMLDTALKRRAAP